MNQNAAFYTYCYFKYFIDAGMVGDHSGLLFVCTIQETPFNLKSELLDFAMRYP
jgi:hypothetical protein